jgi:hypothetical protein
VAGEEVGKDGGDASQWQLGRVRAREGPTPYMAALEFLAELLGNPLPRLG